MFLSSISSNLELGMVVRAFNQGTHMQREVASVVQGQPGLHRRIQEKEGYVKRPILKKKQNSH